jgi:hypothetical protein
MTDKEILESFSKGDEKAEDELDLSKVIKTKKPPGFFESPLMRLNS